jgi:hypothetical protein
MSSKINYNLLPNDFHWRQYTYINKDLQFIKTKKEAIKHYINYGKYEKRKYKIDNTNYKLYIPDDFNWRNYLDINKDLNIRSKKKAIIHYILYGKNRKYKIICKEHKKEKIDNRQLSNNDIINVEPINNITLINSIQNKKKSQINGTDFVEKNDISLETIDIDIDDNNYDFLEENEILYTKLKENIKYLQYDLDLNILDILPSYYLIIDSNNKGDESTFYINTIVSKYKKYNTFIILRFDNEKYYLNINEEYLINLFFYNINDIITVINENNKKINKIIINNLSDYDEKLIHFILTLNNEKVIFTNILKSIKTIKPNYSIEKIIENVDMIINPYDSFDDELNIYKNKITVVNYPNFKFRLKKYKSCNKEIVCCLIGNIKEPKVKLEFEDIIFHFNKKYKNISFILFGNISSVLSIEMKNFTYIEELNNLFIKYNPNIIIELGNSKYYDNILELYKIIDLPIIYSKNISDLKKKIINDNKKCCEFDNMDSLYYLINKLSQDYYYTISPIIAYNKFWNELYILNTKSLFISNKNIKHNIKPYIIYYPQFHEIIENNIIFYKSYNDIKEIEHYNEKNILKLDFPQKNYCETQKYDYILNDRLIQKQIDLINKLHFNGIAVYYYWFTINSFTNKNMIMEKVIDKLFSSNIKTYQQKIFFIWKNLNWSDIYNCNDKFIENGYNSSSFSINSENLIKYFKNDKYLKIDNKPVFIINDSNLIENIDVFYNILNQHCLENNFNGINLIINSKNLDYDNYKNCEIYFNKNNIEKISHLENNIINLDYYKYSDNLNSNNKKIKTITFDFNNTSNINKNTNSKNPIICKNNTEILKTLSTYKIIDSYNKNFLTELDRILLVNSFNNWGEGNAFEPSEKYGYYNLNLLSRLLRD